MIELSAWDTLLYTFVIITLMVVLSRLLAEPPPAVRIRDNKVRNTELLPPLASMTCFLCSERTQMELHRLYHQVPAALQCLRDISPDIHR